MVELNKILVRFLPDRNHNRIVVLQIVPDENQSCYSLEQQNRLSKICLGSVCVLQALLHQTNISCHLLGPLTRQVQNKT